MGFFNWRVSIIRWLRRLKGFRMGRGNGTDVQVPRRN